MNSPARVGLEPWQTSTGDCADVMGEQVGGLAERWGVTVEVAQRMVWEYGAVQGLGLEAAVEELQGMGYAEAVREIGSR